MKKDKRKKQQKTTFLQGLESVCILNPTKLFVFAFIGAEKKIAPDRLSLGGESARQKATCGQANKQGGGGGTAACSKHHGSTREVKLSPPPQVGIHLPVSAPWEGCPDSPSVCPDLCLGLWVE